MKRELTVDCKSCGFARLALADPDDPDSWALHCSLEARGEPCRYLPREPPPKPAKRKAVKRAR